MAAQQCCDCEQYGQREQRGEQHGIARKHLPPLVALREVEDVLRARQSRENDHDKEFVAAQSEQKEAHGPGGGGHDEEFEARRDKNFAAWRTGRKWPGTVQRHPEANEHYGYGGRTDDSKWFQNFIGHIDLKDR